MIVTCEIKGRIGGVAGGSRFFLRKPEAVRTTPAALSAQPGVRGRGAFGSAQLATRRAGVAVASLSATPARCVRHESNARRSDPH